MSRICLERHKKKLDNFQVSIHPYAMPAFEFFNSCVFIFDIPKLKTKQLQSINYGLTLHMIESKNKDLAITSGFEYSTFSLANIHYPSCDIIIHDELNNEDIEKRAWFAVLRSLLTSISPGQLECLRRELNSTAPAHIMTAAFQKKQLSQMGLSNFSSLSRSALSQQHKASLDDMNSHPIGLETSIFHSLKERRLNDGNH